MTARAEPFPCSTRVRWPLQSLFGDLRVRYGTKVGLAGLLALFCALLLRLEHPNWSILTVVVMMNSHYVGSITVKVIMRVLGTIGGALLGIWLIGSYASSPVILLTAVFFLMAFATYKFGQFPASQTPYFHFLVGLTLLTVATYGVDAPDQIWQTGLNRMLETLVGALSALIVTSILWPRYAREEFFEAGRTALETAQKLLSIETDAYIHQREIPGGVEQIRETFAPQLATLRNLLQAGARESTYFRARLSNYNAFLVSLTDLFQSALDLERRRQDESSILERLRDKLEAVNAAISEEFAILTRPRLRHEKLPASQLKARFALLEEEVNAMWGGQERLFLTAPTEIVTAFLGHYSAIRAVCDDLANIRSASEGLPRFGQLQPESKIMWDFLPNIDWFWVRTGIKGGLASVFALFLLRWIHPPGPPAIPLAAWTFTILSRPFLRAGGPGDLRIFQRVFVAALLFIPTVALLHLSTPVLANYAVMNLALFGALFALGFFTVRKPGVGFWTQVVILRISVFVGLNPQQAVPSVTIIDSFLGLTIGIVIAAVVGRLVWPVLPQELFGDDLLKFFVQLQALLNREPHAEKIRTQLAMLPVEAQQAARQMRIAGCPATERAKISRLIRALQALVMQSTALVSHKHVLPETIKAGLRPEFERLEREFNELLETFAQCFRKGDCRRPIPTLREALKELDGALERIRESRILADQKLEVVMHMLELANRYQSMAEALEECGAIIQTLKLDRYLGDYAL
jgi:uncharacterized membrane protein YccC